jgi:crotonobetainyl-CoA:carnitine CoA-transferase CaiB-like acyl-CoA transferase
MEEVFKDPHVVSRDMFFTMDHPTEVSVPQLGFPYKFSNTPLRASKSPPQLGEDTEAVLCEWLTMKRAEVEELRRTGAI